MIWMLFLLAGLLGIPLILQARQAKSARVPPLSQWPVVDLTQPLTPAMPLWPGDPALAIQPWATYAKEGYLTNRISMGEHSGTHWATPNT